MKLMIRKKLTFLIFLIFQNLNSEPFLKSCASSGTICSAEHSQNNFGRTFYSIRPQDSNAARRVLDLSKKNILCLDYDICRLLNVTFEVQKTFNNIGPWFFFNGTNCMTVGNPSDTQTFDIDAQQIGIANNPIAPGEIGKVCISPKMTNIIADLDMILGLDNLVCGLWTRIDIPIVHAVTELNLKTKSDKSSNSVSFPAGLFSLPPGNVDNPCTKTKAPYACIAEALVGNKNIGAVPPLECGKFCTQKQKKTAIAGLHFDLGYDFFRNECGHLGLSLHFVVPTGTRPNDRFIFEPVIGANKSWQLGGTVNASYDIYAPASDRRLTFFLDATLTHLFKAKQTRLFTLKNNGPGSQLLLLKKFNPIDTEVVGAERVANILCGETKIGAGIMVDGAVMLQYNCCNWYFNLGYNFWIRSKENRSKDVCFRNFAENTFGIKGDLPLSQEIDVGTPDCPETQCGSNVDTASESTISQPAAADSVPVFPPISEPVFLSLSDIDFNSVLHPAAATNKVFVTVGYKCNRFKHDVFFDFGAEAEYSKKITALEQWGIIFQAGMSF